jgi:hypothetical protein
MRFEQIAMYLVPALALAACSRTSMTLSLEAGVDATRPVEAAGDAGAIGPVPDAARLGPDSSVMGPEVAPPEVITIVPDARVMDTPRDLARLPDLGIFPDLADRRDTRVGNAEVSARDGVLDRPVDRPVGDSAAVSPDLARPDGDSGEVASNPYASRTFDIDTMHPAPTADPSCTQTEPVDSVHMTFSSDIGTLTGIFVRGSAAIRFSATLGPEANKLTYHVTTPSAGGLITFEQDQGVGVAQATLLGSGVPIVMCIRGALTPQP